MDMPAGRPKKYQKEAEIAICEAISNGQSLQYICQQPGMPDFRTVFLWMETRPKFLEMYTRARQNQAELMATQIVDIADTPLIGEKRKTLKDGSVEVIVGDNVERSKLMVDARKWVAAKLLPKVYGERYQAEHTGSVGLQLVHDVPRPARIDAGAGGAGQDEPPLIEGK
jgi:hypothetical protein